MTEQPFVVEEPGVYLGLSDAAYHTDPVPGGSLSSTGARKLLPPSCPALYRHWADNPQPPRKHFDVGHAAHKVVLGEGPDLEVVPGDRWDTKAAKEKVAEIRERGGVPLKQADYDRVHAMAEALRRHPLAGKLLEPGTGKAEQSMFWQDPETGVWCRCRPDWTSDLALGGRPIVIDYKSADAVDRESIEKAIYRYGYHIQDRFYVRGFQALSLAADPMFLFVVQAKEPPYLVTVTNTDDMAKRIGEFEVREALRLYRECTESGHWPGFYDDDVLTASLPRWVENQYQEMM